MSHPDTHAPRFRVNADGTLTRVTVSESKCPLTYGPLQPVSVASWVQHRAPLLPHPEPTRRTIDVIVGEPNPEYVTAPRLCGHWSWISTHAPRFEAPISRPATKGPTTLPGSSDECIPVVRAGFLTS